MSSHWNAPAPGRPFSPNPTVAQRYPQGSEVDPWAQTWVRPVGVPVGRPPLGPGWPAPGYPPLPPTHRRRWALIGGVAAAVVLLTAGAGMLIAVAGGSSGPDGPTTASEPVSSPPPSTPTSAATPPSVVPIDALPGLLLDPGVVNGIEGTNGMVVRPDPNAGSGSGFADLPSDRPECLGVQHPAMVSALQGSGWVAAQTQVLSEPTEDWKHLVSNAVVDFPSAQLASDYAAHQAEAWARCAGKSLTTKAVGEGPVTWSVGPAGTRNGVVSVVLTQEGAVGWGCQRALTARNNVVVDARSCGFNRGDQAVAIATKIADRVHTTNP